MERGTPNELTMLIVRSGPPAKAGLGPTLGGLVGTGSRAPPEAVPRAAEVDSACGARAIKPGPSAKACFVRARTQPTIQIEVSIMVTEHNRCEGYE